MRRIYQALIISCLLLLIGGCQQPAQRLISLQATPVLTANQQSQSDSPAPTFVSERGGFTLTLPSGWRLTDMVDAADEQLPARLAQTPNAQLVELADAFLAADGLANVEVVALYEAGPAHAALVIAVVPQHDLTLQTYVRAAVQQLAQFDGVTIEEQALRYDMLPNNLPLTAIHTSSSVSPVQAITDSSYQLTFLSPASEHLTIFTFSTALPHFETMRPRFDAILQQIEFQQES